jgi:hypothetical protein
VLKKTLIAKDAEDAEDAEENLNRETPDMKEMGARLLILELLHIADVFWLQDHCFDLPPRPLRPQL